MRKSDEEIEELEEELDDAEVYGLERWRVLCDPDEFEQLLEGMSDLDRKIAYFKGSQEELDKEMFALLDRGEATPNEVNDAMQKWSPFEIIYPEVGTVWSCEQDRKNGNELAFCC